MADVGARGAIMSSRDEISALVHEYADRLDAGDLDGVANLFSHGAYGLADGPASRGAAGVRAALRIVRLHGGSPRTKHAVTNLVIEIDEAARTATARSYFTVLQATEELPLQTIVAGRYHDRFERADGRWRFHERRIFLDLLGNVSQHLTADLPGSPDDQ
jgi:3-phenylpropionate/cinnamic acid dioxygenase small subunit